MNLTQLASNYWVSPQITIDEVSEAKAQGFTAVVCNRPNGEEIDQPTIEEIGSACEQAGLHFIALPMQGPNFTPDMVKSLQQMLDTESKILAYCRTGNRSSVLYKAAQEA